VPPNLDRATDVFSNPVGGRCDMTATVLESPCATCRYSANRNMAGVTMVGSFAGEKESYII
jgi:hypothetical protein